MLKHGRQHVNPGAPGTPYIVTLTVASQDVDLFALGPNGTMLGDRAVVTRLVAVNEGGVATTVELYDKPGGKLLGFLGLPATRENQVLDGEFIGDASGSGTSRAGFIPCVRMTVGSSPVRIMAWISMTAVGPA